MMDMVRRICNGLRSERGQTLTEYGLILVFVAVACVGALGFLGLAINDWYTDFAGLLASLT